MHQKDLIIKKTFAIAYQNHQKSNFKVAENLYKKILRIDPHHFESTFYLAILLLGANNFDGAKQLFQKTIQIQPNYAPAYNNLGIVFNALKEPQKAIGFYRKAIQIQPNYAHAHNNLGMVFRDLGEFENAINCFQMAIKIQTNYVAAHHNLGVVFQKKREHQKAISYFQKAIQIKFNHAVTHYNLGTVFTEVGEFEKAINSYQMAIKYEPKNLAHFYYLSDLKKEILDSNLKKNIYEIIKDSNCTKRNIAYGNFLLSRYELKDKNYKKEFNYLLEGHYNYFESQGKQFKKQVKYWLSVLPNIKKLANLNNTNKRIKKNTTKMNPIFIIGVPRCGSTLVEKVIASGGKYIQVGEETEILNFFVKQEIQQKQLLKLNIENFEKKIIAKYEEKGLIQKRGDYTFTDKSLDNFFYINLIKRIFPNAKVINCKRNPLSCVISILKNNLTGLAWAHNLEHIFKYLDLYYKIIKNFKKKHPDFIYELQYEKFVNDPETESKKLLKFCNISWNKKSLEFFKRKDLISQTASNIQIRKAIYKDSIKKYLPYKEYLNKYGNKYFWYN